MKSVLLIDDDDSIRSTVAEVLSEADYEVIEARDGEEALNLLKRGHRPAVTLLDLMMPGTNGWEFLDKAERDPKLGDLRVLLFTAVKDVVLNTRLVVGVVKKPVDLDELLSLIAQHASGPAKAESS